MGHDSKRNEAKEIRRSVQKAKEGSDGHISRLRHWKSKVSEMELDDRVFDAKIKESLFYEVVRKTLASQRSGTSARRIGRGSRRGQSPGNRKGPEGAGRFETVADLEGGGTMFGPMQEITPSPSQKGVGCGAESSAES